MAEQGIGLAEAIGLLRDELLKARAAGRGQAVQLPVQSLTVELKVAATRKADGRAGFSVPVVNVELGGSSGWQRDTMQTVTVVFGAPVDPAGEPIPLGLDSAAHERRG